MPRRFAASITAFVALFILSSATFAADPFAWHTSDPETEGLSRERLETLRDDLRIRSTVALLIIRHDRVAFEWYADTSGPDRPHGTASLAKALVGGTSLAVAMQDGRLKPDDAVSAFISEWRGDPAKAKITIAQLATHTSGLDDAEEQGVPHDKLTGWKGEFWRREPTDPFTLARDATPLVAPPGREVRYSNPGMAMLSYAITAAIQPGEQKNVRSLLAHRVFERIGIAPAEWSAGYGKSYRVNGIDLVANWGGATITARAAARVGRLMLREGDWDGRRLLDASIVRACVDVPRAPAANEWQGPRSPRPGFGWWTNRDAAWPSVPRDAYLGAGAGDQLLLVVPSLDLIAVRFGSKLAPTEPNWVGIYDHFLAPLVLAVTDPPYPPSNVIRSIRFDPAESIIRKAIDSDNWPMTWADDDRLYTAYGDGSGFEPFVERKLSMGVARVEGTPPDFAGFNVRSATAERTGGGVKGPKASGMLMVDGALYMWIRNTANATIARSTDHGATWEWGFKFDGESFGCPTFLNFGRNYAGAADDFVYAYSQDGPSAYEPYDGIVLARVPKTRIMERSAHEFYAGADADGVPRWTTDLAKRQHVFHYPGHCERLDAVYDPALKRYLLAVSFGHGKGWGIFDAPRPWGPWTTSYITRDWGLGETHGYRLPSKWSSPDGTRRWLVFSGRKYNGVEYDAFCARGMTIETYPPKP